MESNVKNELIIMASLYAECMKYAQKIEFGLKTLPKFFPPDLQKKFKITFDWNTTSEFWDKGFRLTLQSLFSIYKEIGSDLTIVTLMDFDSIASDITKSRNFLAHQFFVDDREYLSNQDKILFLEETFQIFKKHHNFIEGFYHFVIKNSFEKSGYDPKLVAINIDAIEYFFETVSAKQNATN